MGDMPVTTTTEYITQDQLNAVVDELRASIQQVTQDMAHIVDDRIQHAVAKERDERIDQLRQMAVRQDERFEKLEGQLTSIGNDLTGVSATMQNVAGKLDVWGEAMQMRRAREDEIEQDLNRHATDISLLTSTSVAHSEQIRTLRGDIFGNPDQPHSTSISEMVRKLGDQMTHIQQGIHVNRDNIGALSLAFQTDLAQRQRQESQRRERWQRYRKAGLELLKAVSSSRIAMGAVLLGIATSLIGIAPQLEAVIVQLLESMQ
jgi:uncharacterized phage infection (PIP) family protein YhgE